MARKLPPNAAPPDDLDAAGIEATLARLPDAWTLVVDRRIGGADGPPVAWVLLHPDIGIAIVDLAPAEPRHAADALRALLDAADPADRALAGVPIVALALGVDASAAVGQQLADAFAAAPPCRTPDPDWTDRVIGLLLTAEDAAMAPLGPPVPPQPEPSWQPRIGPEDAIAPPRPQARRPAHRLPLAGAVAFLALAVLAVTYLLARGPIADTSTAVVAPMPVGAPAQRADTMPASGPTGTEAAAPPLATPPAQTAATPPPPTTSAPPPQTAAAPPPPAPQPASPVSVSPPPQPVAAPPPENAAASPPPPQPTEAATPAAPPPAPAAIPRPTVARRPVRRERSRETALAHPAPPPARPVAPLAASPSGPPIDAGDLPPLAPPAGMPEPEQQAANRPIAAPRPPMRRDGAPAVGQPVMLLPPVGPPAAMPPPPSSGPGAGAFVGGPP